MPMRNREARVAPVSVILHLGEDLLRGCALACDPQDNTEVEEADDVGDREYAFCQWKLSRTVYVERSCGNEK